VVCVFAFVAAACGDDTAETTGDASTTADTSDASTTDDSMDDSDASMDDASMDDSTMDDSSMDDSADASMDDASMDDSTMDDSMDDSMDDASMDDSMAMPAYDYGVDTEEMVIRVGINTDLSGIFAPLTTKITDGHLAYWEWLNDNGGVNGWTIEPVVLDNAYDVPTHLENYEVMAGDGDQSVVMFSTSTGSPHTASTAEALIEDNMAAIPLSWYSGWADPEIGRNVFEVQANYCIEAMNGATYMSETYGNKMAIASFPGDYGEDGAEGAKVAAEALGLEIVYDGQAAVIPGPDLTPVIASIADSGADSVWLTTNPTTTA